MNTHDKLLKWLQSDEGSLPTLAVVLDRIISVASDPDTTIQELAAVISYDQGMTNNLLRLANSAYYAQREKVESVKRAIAVIGFDEILGITLSMEILSTFKNKSQYRLNLKNQWVHSICVATAAKEIAKKTDPDIAGKIFIPALLHDMGKVILSIHFVEEYIGACKNAAHQKILLYQAEQDVFGMTHADFAAMLMVKWNFPDSIIMPCKYHHHPEDAPKQYFQSSLIVSAADYAAIQAGIGHSGNPVPPPRPELPESSGITPFLLENIRSYLLHKKREIDAFFAITFG